MSSTKEDYRLKRVAVSDIKVAPYNPPRRTVDGKMRHLQKSIESIGLVYPLAINERNELIDGHRRLVACKKLGWDTVPVIIVAGERDAIYADVNATARRMSGNDNLNVYMANPQALPQHVRRYLETAEAALGRDILHKMAKTGASIAYYRWALDVTKYVERAGDNEFLRKIVRWFMHHKASRSAMFAMKGEVPPRVLERAILKNRPLTHKYAVA